MEEPLRLDLLLNVFVLWQKVVPLMFIQASYICIHTEYIPLNCVSSSLLYACSQASDAGDGSLDAEGSCEYIE
jgi:hypothetical protein